MTKVGLYRRNRGRIRFFVWLSGLIVLSLAAVIQSGCGNVLQKKMSAQEAKTTVAGNSGETAQTATPEKNRHQITQAYGKLPFQFEANQGQTDPEVKFLTRGRGYTLFLMPTQAVLALRNFDAKTDPQNIKEHFQDQQGSAKSEFATLRIKLLGANPASRMSGLEELPGKVNYFIGTDPTKWHKNIPTYVRVKYSEVYPGIDLVYYGNQGQVEHDFLIAPGADPARIKLAFEGTQTVQIDSRGELVLQTNGGEVRLLKPDVYQEVNGVRQPIAANYVLQEPLNVRAQKEDQTGHQTGHGTQVGFQIAAYDAGKPLIIDPVLVYSTYLGGSGFDQGNGITVDSLDSAYVTGFTSSINFPTVTPIQGTLSGSIDVFVTKLNPAGSALVYSTYLGGSAGDAGYGIAVDGSGNAYVTGFTTSTNFPTMNPFQPTLGASGGPNAFVAKLNTLGSALVYSTYLGGGNIPDVGGGGSDVGYGIAVDSSGNAYVSGHAANHDFPTTAGSLKPTTAAGDFIEAFVTKLNTAGSALVYSTYLGGVGDDRGYSIAVDSSGNAYVTGYTATGPTVTNNFPTVNPFQASSGGGFDAFVSKINPAGSALVYSTYLGGSGTAPSGSDAAYSIAVDSSGNAYVTGYTSSTNFPTMNALQPVKAGISTTGDVFVTELNAAGSALVYSTYLGGTGNEVGYGIRVDNTGNAYLTGLTTSLDFPTVDATQIVFGGGAFDGFATKVNPAGSGLVYSTYLGGSGDDRGFGIGLDSVGGAYLAGNTGSANFPTANPLQAASGGSFDTFVSKLQ